jgi:hypothetical protein
VFHNCVWNEKGQLPGLHQTGEQKSVLGSEGGRVEDVGLDVRPTASNGESSRIQVSNAGIRLQHEGLKGCKP